MSIKYWHNCVQIKGRQIGNASPLFIIGTNGEERTRTTDKEIEKLEQTPA
jgi:hypothetical protein